MNNRFAEVFKPGTYPELTYVTRDSEKLKYTYEQRLNQSLNIDGNLSYIVGASKIGKTVLCEKVIGKDKIISMTGHDFESGLDFWDSVGKKAGLSMEGEFSEENSSTSQNEHVSKKVKRNYQGNKDRVVDYFIMNRKVLLLDDFHYASDEVQYDIACQLKEVIRQGFKAVVISLPHRSDDAIRQNPDLMGRLSLIEIMPWEQSDLEKIARKGFQELKLCVDNKLIERMAVESINSPQLMQSICLNIGILHEEIEIITNEVIEESCRFTCENFPYGDVVRVLKAGPSTREQKRLQYEMNNKVERDLYSVILKVLADNPPMTEIRLENITDRIQSSIRNTKITTKKIKDTLNSQQKILDEQGALYQVFEWKDDIIYITDPLFLFYIRWID